ncbi:MAG TPA: hypothetical protein VHC44_14665 [Verrucomicrobiae bacterium]|nr:hypothetical protein [Verrucomicrobiae bacterium]
MSVTQVRYCAAFVVIMALAAGLVIWLTGAGTQASNAPAADSAAPAADPNQVVQIAVRPRTSGPGTVLQIVNVKKDGIRNVELQIEDPDTHKILKSNKDFWPAGTIIEIGEDAQQWSIQPGQVLTIKGEGVNASITLK